MCTGSFLFTRWGFSVLNTFPFFYEKSQIFNCSKHGNCYGKLRQINVTLIILDFFLQKPIKIDVLEMAKKRTILANKSKGLNRVSVKGNHEILVYMIKHILKKSLKTSLQDCEFQIPYISITE